MVGDLSQAGPGSSPSLSDSAWQLSEPGSMCCLSYPKSTSTGKDRTPFTFPETCHGETVSCHPLKRGFSPTPPKSGRRIWPQKRGFGAPFSFQIPKSAYPPKKQTHFGGVEKGQPSWVEADFREVQNGASGPMSLRGGVHVRPNFFPFQSSLKPTLLGEKRFEPRLKNGSPWPFPVRCMVLIWMVASV